jgi:Fe2+ or Zn2+ uptake regulation protein
MNYSRQRELILNILKETDSHPTAEWIHQEARKSIPNIGIATVYRNLNALAEIGECIRIPQPGGLDRFDGCTGEHYHMICRECGRLVDLHPVSDRAVTEMKETLQNTFGEGAEVEVTTVLLRGFCEECKGKAKN